MKLSEFRELIEKIHGIALNSEVEHERQLAQAMSPAEYYAYDVIKAIIGDVESRIDTVSRYETAAADDALSDVLEFVTDYVEQNETWYEANENPHVLEMVIEL